MASEAAPEACARALLAIEETTMKRDEEIVLLGYEPVVLSYRSKPDLMAISCKLIERIPGEDKTRRTDKRVRLGLTIRDAMKLLRLLQNLQKDLDLPPAAGQSTKMVIPPKGQRH
jgi:hypothetical protein